MEFFGKIVIAGLMNGAIYGLVAIGFVLIYKSSSVLNFSQGYMLLLGAYIFWFFKGSLKLDLLPSLLTGSALGLFNGHSHRTSHDAPINRAAIDIHDYCDDFSVPCPGRIGVVNLGYLSVATDNNLAQRFSEGCEHCFDHREPVCLWSCLGLHDSAPSLLPVHPNRAGHERSG